MTLFPSVRISLLSLAACVLLGVPALAADEPTQDSLDEVIRKQAPELNKYLREQKYANVGVVKFLVKRGDAAPSDNVGELNLSLASRLEVALVLANPDENLGIIQQASRTISKENNVRANHLTKEGRKAFFTHEYDLAWGPRKVEASAFVTGLVTISKDLKETRIRLQVFDKEGEIKDVLDEIIMETPSRILTEAGYSYLLTAELNPEAFAQAKKTKKNHFPDAVLRESVTPPLAFVSKIDPPNVKVNQVNPYRDGPVKLTVLYDGKPQTIAQGIVPEPDDSVKDVTFVIENPTKDTYAIVLKLNGVNTLFKETYPEPIDCHKWVLKPGEKQSISGFQMDDKTVDGFKVLSRKQSEADEVYYGPLAGEIRLACFKGSIEKDDPTLVVNQKRDDTELAVAAIAKGTLNVGDIPAGSLGALKRSLRGREKDGDGAKGLIVQGGKQGMKEIVRFFFKPDLGDAVQDVKIQYYKPKSK